MDQEFKPKNHNNFWTLLVVCAFVGVIFITATFIWQEIKMQDNIVALTKLAREKLRGEQKNKQDWQTYNSAKFGLSFDYWTSGEGAAAVKEVDHTIYVYNTKAVPETGQYVRVFIKTAGTTLKDAITEQFLKGYDAKDCFAVNTSDWPVTGSGTSVLPGWNTATIGFPMTNNNVDPWWENSSKCPETYTASNGISFFAEDPAHPNQFLFFSIGQYAINGNASDNSWYQTIKFVDQNSDWQTYENSDLGFSFQYPSTFTSFKDSPSNDNKTWRGTHIASAKDNNNDQSAIYIYLNDASYDPNNISGLYGKIDSAHIKTVMLGNRAGSVYLDGDAGCGGKEVRTSINANKTLWLSFFDCADSFGDRVPFYEQDNLIKEILATFKFTK